MHPFLHSVFAPSRRDASAIGKINAMRREFAQLSDDDLDALAFGARKDLLRLIALTAVIASRSLGQQMFDVQFRGALALTRGSIAEMQTGEGKTLAAVPAIAWYAHEGMGVHVLTANDYLARRDACWMGDIYRRLGFSVGYVQQGMTPDQRRAAYACDVTYATANEAGFDFLRDQLALELREQVHRPFHAAVIDEVDSILIDEARIPLVIAGGSNDESALAFLADQVVRSLRSGVHYRTEIGGRNVGLTDEGIRAVEHATRCRNLFDENNLQLFTAVQDALHAHALLHRDVDYVVKNGAVEMIDEFKGRTAQDRRWPAGLHTAIEIKERVAAKLQGMILGSITMQHMAALYPHLCGMTGTAASSQVEFQTMYLLPVEVIPTNRPMIRVDHPDEVFATRAEKTRAAIEEIRRAHATGQPVLVGTASVRESEELSRSLADIPHHVLNAKNDEQEAAIIAQAGQRGAVTISTNMAGRGTDIQLGEGLASLGGLYVIGTNKHESRRIDNQLRGRAGRQGDPGCSRFFVSLQDELMVKGADLNPKYSTDPESVQPLVEGQNLDLRIFLQKYEIPVEGQRNRIQSYRQKILDGSLPCGSELERLITLRTIDDLWADYLARLADYRAGLHWLSLAGRNPHLEYLRQIDQWFPELETSIPEETARRLAEAEAGGGEDPQERGAVWTYVTTDQPFGTLTERIVRGLMRKFKNRDLWA
ncbi:MAG: preprotein translocase subunit SecA [Acidobacteriaceae bacterium]|nr:preprotein translocase subunit SecA [Acidobacteriaceae bacterium]MBV9502069.1 preprotein translocase subunit SecA [Acidobacteriaceae bacterium]